MKHFPAEKPLRVCRVNSSHNIFALWSALASPFHEQKEPSTNLCRYRCSVNIASCRSGLALLLGTCRGSHTRHRRFENLSKPVEILERSSGWR